MKKNKKAVSLIIVMGIVLVTGLLAITIIELIIPFSRSVSGMENSSKAYYLANAGVEEAMLNIKKNNDNSSILIDTNKKFDITGNNPTGHSNSLTKSFSDRILTVNGSTEPKVRKGDSEFDKDFNKISVGLPLQLRVDNSQLYGKITFQKPKINGINYNLDPNKCYISWQLSSDIGFINSNEKNCIKGNKINGTEFTIMSLSPFNLGNLNYSILYISDKNDNSYLTNNGKEINLPQASSTLGCNNGNCILKFSIINELNASYASSSVVLPYLEWKIRYDNGLNYKLRYSTIESTGKSNNFVKKLEVKVPQATVNEAFDFTVFQ